MNRLLRIAFALWLLCYCVVMARAEQANWTGPYVPCGNASELLRSTHMDLAVAFDTRNHRIEAATKEALNFYAHHLLDMSWHVTADHAECAMAIEDAVPGLFGDQKDVARAQLPSLAGFHGLIAFEPHADQYMSQSELYTFAVHEIGHLLGLLHNPSPHSIMYYIDVDTSSQFDAADLSALAAHHALRVSVQ